MAILPNYWAGNKFMIPNLPPQGILNQPMPPQGILNQPTALQIAGIGQPDPTQSGGINATSGDVTANPDTGVPNAAAGPAVNIGIGPPSGAPGTGGAAGLMGAIAGLAAPAVANVVSHAISGKGIGEQVMNAAAEMGLSPNPTAAQSGNAVAAEANAASPGTGAMGGVAGVGSNIGTSSDPEASIAAPSDGAGGAGTGDSTVICTLMYQRGYLPREVYAADQEYGRKADADLMRGYHSWAVPYVRIAGGSGPIASCLFGLAKLLAIPWAREMAYRAGVLDKGSSIGAFLFFSGVPACRFLGKILNAYRPAFAKAS